MATIAQTQKRILRAATTKPLLASEIAQKLNDKHPGEGYADARAIGRPLGALVKEGDLIKEGRSRPKYRKPTAVEQRGVAA